MNKRLQVLLIEDSEDDAELMIHALRRGGFEFHHERVTTDRELQWALKTQEWDLALCDYNLPGLYGRQALATITSAQPDIAVIFVSGIIGEETAAELMRSGAKDYVRKDNLVRLNSAIERELAAAETRSRQRKVGEKLRIRAEAAAAPDGWHSRCDLLQGRGQALHPSECGRAWDPEHGSGGERDRQV